MSGCLYSTHPHRKIMGPLMPFTKQKPLNSLSLTCIIYFLPKEIQIDPQTPPPTTHKSFILDSGSCKLNNGSCKPNSVIYFFPSFENVLC